MKFEDVEIIFEKIIAPHEFTLKQEPCFKSNNDYNSSDSGYMLPCSSNSLVNSVTPVAIVENILSSEEETELENVLAEHPPDQPKRSSRKRRHPIRYDENRVDSDDSDGDSLFQEVQTIKELYLNKMAHRNMDAMVKNPASLEDFDRVRIRLDFEFFEQKSKVFKKVIQILGKASSYVTNLILEEDPEQEIPYDKIASQKISNLFQRLDLLSSFTLKFVSLPFVCVVLQALDKFCRQNKFKRLKALCISSWKLDTSSYLKEEHLELLDQVLHHTKINCFELTTNIWQDVKAETLEGLIGAIAETIESFKIMGTLIGISNQNTMLVKIPDVPRLKELILSPCYKFSVDDEAQDVDVLTLDDNETESTDNIVALPINFSFSCRYSNLYKIVLGGLSSIQNFHFGLARKLSIFKVSGPWNLDCKFGLKNPCFPSISEIQFPDNLMDFHFIQQAAKAFPNVGTIHLYLPSAKVLLATFQYFKDHKISQLDLKTQYHFESTLESCLLGRPLQDRSDDDISKFRQLRSYKHYREFIKAYNIQPPLTLEDFADSNTPNLIKEENVKQELALISGIDCFKHLKTLRLEHVPSVLQIPRRGEQKKWWDHSCKMSIVSIGFMKYPMPSFIFGAVLAKCEIEEIIWNNFKIDGYLEERIKTQGWNHTKTSNLHNDISQEVVRTNNSRPNKVRKGLPKVTVPPWISEVKVKKEK